MKNVRWRLTSCSSWVGSQLHPQKTENFSAATIKTTFLVEVEIRDAKRPYVWYSKLTHAVQEIGGLNLPR